MTTKVTGKSPTKNNAKPHNSSGDRKLSKAAAEQEMFSIDEIIKCYHLSYPSKHKPPPENTSPKPITEKQGE